MLEDLPQPKETWRWPLISLAVDMLVYLYDEENHTEEVCRKAVARKARTAVRILEEGIHN